MGQRTSDDLLAEALADGVPERAAGIAGYKRGTDAFDEAAAEVRLMLVEFSRKFEERAGGPPWLACAVQHAKWALALARRREARYARDGAGGSLDAAAGDDPDGAARATLTADAKSDDPSEVAEVNEWKERNGVGRNGFSLDQVRAVTPKPEGVGLWAEKLRAAAFDAVGEHDMKELMEGLVERAKKGDLKAAKLVLEYLTGGGAPKVQQVVMVNNTRRGRKPKAVDVAAGEAGS